MSEGIFLLQIKENLMMMMVMMMTSSRHPGRRIKPHYLSVYTLTRAWFKWRSINVDYYYDYDRSFSTRLCKSALYRPRSRLFPFSFSFGYHPDGHMHAFYVHANHKLHSKGRRPNSKTRQLCAIQRNFQKEHLSSGGAEVTSAKKVWNLNRSYNILV